MKKNLKTLLVLICIGLAYYIFLNITGIKIPCVFREITGYKCPGCGVTTMIICLSHLNFLGAFNANPMLFITGPFLIGEVVYIFFIKAPRKVNKINDYVLILYCVALLLFGLFRNIL